MSSKDDLVPIEYKYAWTPDSELTLPDFLKKCKPSMVQNTDGTKPWIWVKKGAPSRKDEGEQEALEEGGALLDEVTARVEEIKNDPSIPARSSKKTGAKGKKEVREQVQSEATDKLREIAIKHGFVTGKWLSFAAADKVDAIWGSIASSLVSGPLAETCAFLAKVATSPADGNSSTQHLICVYMPDVYDKPAVTEVMKVLLRSHGVNLSGVKSDMYTLLGIDSKHPSGIPSTTWKNATILPESEIKALREAYFENLSATKDEAKVTADQPAADKSAEVAKAKAKPQLKKKQADDDPFASEDEEDEEEAQRKAELKSKKAPPPKKRAKDESDEDDEEDGRPKKKTAKK
ncbi:hypothetical protein GGX14DRAFT_452894 [Mycena pura]|uniref:Uncharacterized protein n=1 Tax=Mycena pura TaxID=153505 RepID=A0AAD6VKP6_9AGAR|nr:hypothetical protein GGX14DRAFT_452894 [Mycena pura]